MSEGMLASSVLELTHALTRNAAAQSEREKERDRLIGIRDEFKSHLTWQSSRLHALKRNIERLYNERQWLSGKTAEVTQDSNLLAHETRQAKAELDQVTQERDSLRAHLRIAQEELLLESESAAALQQICSQASKALTVHARERDACKAELEAAKQDVFRTKDRVEKVAYQLNGVGTLA
mmetsp:Transcript_35153/g.75045  ORF Transcript_35153/g.75045 Transcript_35153/m.75045 type:complete len:179 (-) Transcript_35153:431-967(-)